MTLHDLTDALGQGLVQPHARHQPEAPLGRPLGCERPRNLDGEATGTKLHEPGTLLDDACAWPARAHPLEQIRLASPLAPRIARRYQHHAIVADDQQHVETAGARLARGVVGERGARLGRQRAARIAREQRARDHGRERIIGAGEAPRAAFHAPHCLFERVLGLRHRRVEAAMQLLPVAIRDHLARDERERREREQGHRAERDRQLRREPHVALNRAWRRPRLQ